jgi:AcrR family transcriptional regulator
MELRTHWQLVANNPGGQFDNGQKGTRCSRMRAMLLKSKKLDRRTTRTKRSLSEALVELIHEKRFDDITVQDVIDRADVGRSTFYSHFRDKEDLFQKDWQQFLDGFASHIDWEKAGKESFVPVVYLFRHLQEYQQFYKGLVRSRKTEAVFKSGVNYLSQRIEATLTTRFMGKAAPSLPLPILSNYLAVELFALLKWWLDHQMPYPPERMDEIFHELVTPTFQTALKNPVK